MKPKYPGDESVFARARAAQLSARMIQPRFVSLNDDEEEMVSSIYARMTEGLSVVTPDAPLSPLSILITNVQKSVNSTADSLEY